MNRVTCDRNGMNRMVRLESREMRLRTCTCAMIRGAAGIVVRTVAQLFNKHAMPRHGMCIYDVQHARSGMRRVRTTTGRSRP
jgi:hypothetical protein